MIRREVAVHEVLQLGELVGEIVRPGAVHPAAQRVRGQLVAAGRAAQAQVDPAGVQRCQRAELLGHHHRRVIGQHDAARPHPDACSSWPRGAPAAPPGPTTPPPASRGARPPRTGGIPALRRARPRSVVAASASPTELPTPTPARSSTDSRKSGRPACPSCSAVARSSVGVVTFASSRQTLSGSNRAARGLFPRRRAGRDDVRRRAADAANRAPRRVGAGRRGRGRPARTAVQRAAPCRRIWSSSRRTPADRRVAAPRTPPGRVVGLQCGRHVVGYRDALCCDHRRIPIQKSVLSRQPPSSCPSPHAPARSDHRVAPTRCSTIAERTCARRPSARSLRGIRPFLRGLGAADPAVRAAGRARRTRTGSARAPPRAITSSRSASPCPGPQQVAQRDAPADRHRRATARSPAVTPYSSTTRPSRSPPTWARFACSAAMAACRRHRPGLRRGGRSADQLQAALAIIAGSQRSPVDVGRAAPADPRRRAGPRPVPW